MSNMKLQTAARSPLLQQLMARQASQGPTDFRGQHPLAAAMHGITQGLQMRALRKAEAEKQRMQDEAGANLQRAISGESLPLPESQDEFSVGDSLQVQKPGTSQDILVAAMNPNINRQQAQIAGSIAQQRQPKAASDKPLIQHDPSKNLVNPITGEIVREGKPDTKSLDVIGKINPDKFTPESVEKFNKTVSAGDPDYSVLRFSDRVQKTQAVRPALEVLSDDEKKTLGLNPLSQYLRTKEGLKEFKPSNMTDAFKFSQLQGARRNWDAAKELIFDKDEDGNIRFSRMKRGWQQLVGGAGGRAVFALGFQAIETYLRGTSGAAVPETEVDRAMKMFMPDARDTNETAQLKMKMLESFLDGTYDILVPDNASREDREAVQISMIDAAQSALAEAMGNAEKPDTADERDELEALRKAQGGR